MNKEKQEEIRGFLAWLEEFMGAKVDGLSNKTKVSAYYEIDFGELLAVLKKNKKKLGVDGEAFAAAVADRKDRPAHRCDRVPALRPHRGGGRHRRGEPRVILK